ncbi:MAG TPA: hypothetical protein VK598_08335, partial [Nitrospiraceae bacterium]|nr:hypothetical protein [Nitrospiraceae bacterium]
VVQRNCQVLHYFISVALFWSAVTCHRFRPSRPVATLLATGRPRPKRRQVGALQICFAVPVFYCNTKL